MEHLVQCTLTTYLLSNSTSKAAHSVSDPEKKSILTIFKLTKTGSSLKFLTKFPIGNHFLKVDIVNRLS